MADISMSDLWYVYNLHALTQRMNLTNQAYVKKEISESEYIERTEIFNKSFEVINKHATFDDLFDKYLMRTYNEN